MSKDPGRILIFDTTLRDGEQSPGASLNLEEKLAIAHQLARLGVDVIEAGFPFASPGDFKAVNKIANAVGKENCLLYTSPSPRDSFRSRMPSSA